MILPPTREDHAAEARAALGPRPDDVPTRVWDVGAAELIERAVQARATERHAARVESAMAACAAAADQHMPATYASAPGQATFLLALLALVGQGGPGDMGGPRGASALPLLPAERRWRCGVRCGPAWVAALRGALGAAGPWRLDVAVPPHDPTVTTQTDLVVVVRDLGIGSDVPVVELSAGDAADVRAIEVYGISAEVVAALRRVLRAAPGHPVGIDGSDVPIIATGHPVLLAAADRWLGQICAADLSEEASR